MRLQRLQIAGFKSFSDRSELAFDEGVTAIVGPNGCGKSNVADAITWVLGEQSAKSLRGDKMEDVIFSGSDARKPTGSAEVKLLLTDVTSVPSSSRNGSHEEADGFAHVNGNGHEPAEGAANGNGHAAIADRQVEVIRRLYRSGESEYLIDGQTCRLKDVHELLMDTGLGAKAYAIIEQGKIGLILSSRPADRRQLIEEAAGITKYRSRRRAAELKLDAAQQNLVRIDDIVFEVEKQRGTLKRQAAKARRYKRLRDEYRRWEKVLFARRYRELAASIEGTRTRLGLAREREAAAAARLAGVETELGRLRLSQTEADTRASAIREDAHARELDINRRQQQFEFNHHQADTLEVRGTEIESEIDDLGARREPARIAMESRRGAQSDAERSRDEAADVMASANAAYATAQQQIEGLDAEVEAARQSVYMSANSVMAMRHVLEHTAAQYERVGEALAKLDVEEDDLRREQERVAYERTAAIESLTRAQHALESIGLQHAARKSELASARAEHEGRAREVRTREQELAAVDARLASL